jgi:hypothetical protein
MTEVFPGSPNTYPVTAPYVAAIPSTLMQGDSGEWIDQPFTDANGTEYDSGTYTLKYVLAGPTAPLTLTATANGSSWQTNLTTTQSAALTAAKYFWSLQIFGTGTRITIATGELTVEPDYSLAAPGFDNRTVAEKAYSDAQNALATFQASGGRVQSYTIGNRHMAFQRDADILAIVNFWKSAVAAEHMKAKGARGRMIGIRFGRAH